MGLLPGVRSPRRRHRSKDPALGFEGQLQCGCNVDAFHGGSPRRVNLESHVVCRMTRARTRAALTD
eukprot:1810501-Prymnesium_polylepis.2